MFFDTSMFGWSRQGKNGKKNNQEFWGYTFIYYQDEEEAGLLELLKSQICDNAALYAQKYDEEFQPYLPRFVTAIWNLLVTTGQEVKYDLVSLTVWFYPD